MKFFHESYGKVECIDFSERAETIRKELRIVLPMLGFLIDENTSRDFQHLRKMVEQHERELERNRNVKKGFYESFGKWLFAAIVGAFGVLFTLLMTGKIK